MQTLFAARKEAPLMSPKTKVLILIALNVLAYTSIALGASVLSSISLAPDVNVRLLMWRTL